MIACRICGCTEVNACTDPEGGRDNCHWIDRELCSYCLDAMKQVRHLVELTILVRNTQKLYFKTRNAATLRNAKELESKLDHMIIGFGDQI